MLKYQSRTETRFCCVPLIPERATSPLRDCNLCVHSIPSAQEKSVQPALSIDLQSSWISITFIMKTMAQWTNKITQVKGIVGIH